jgi:hypothetical protein
MADGIQRTTLGSFALKKHNGGLVSKLVMKGNGIAGGPIGQRYRLHAAKVRGLAREAKSTETRSEFLRIAILYESLADYMRDLLYGQPREGA